jgi:hypothetical protein
VVSSSSSSSCLHFFHLCLSSLLECIEEEEEKEKHVILLATSTSLLLRMSTRRPKNINWLNLNDRHKLWVKGRDLFPLGYCDPNSNFSLHLSLCLYLGYLHQWWACTMY